MQGMISKVQRFLISEDGPTAVEYAVMLALIVVTIVAVMPKLTTMLDASFAQTSTAMIAAS